MGERERDRERGRERERGRGEEGEGTIRNHCKANRGEITGFEHLGQLVKPPPLMGISNNK